MPDSKASYTKLYRELCGPTSHLGFFDMRGRAVVNNHDQCMDKHLKKHEHWRT
ncbi:hypothetical protein FHS83_002307 [Rhizomicrobium palustre]|uniref:Uncharacterized protein n=1 Tax=Rhizomicrobium palustre TaxID=189966 RepID=A0A846N0G5_9PROT|nr:hypothetical protein [Rhizomicrobium palustre]